MLLALHVTTAVVDTYVDIRWWQAVLPWVGSTYLPLWLGLMGAEQTPMFNVKVVV